MSEKMTTRLAYLDHNILDSILKGDRKDIRGFLRTQGFIPVFSNENLAEIHRSRGYEQQFLQLLKELGAKHLSPEFDRDFRHTGRAFVKEVDPYEAYAQYVDDLNEVGSFDRSLRALLEKLYGGRTSESFREIVAGVKGDLTRIKEFLTKALATTPNPDEHTRAKALDVIERIEHFDTGEYIAVARRLDEAPAAAVVQFADRYSLGPKVLNNIKPPDVVKQIWALLQPGIGDEIDLDTFLGLKPFPVGATEHRHLTVLEKVNAVYHQLNFVGYWRDTRMHRPAKFTSSFSDMTHAGLASFCHVLIAGDRKMLMKAAAAYEYLNVSTEIVGAGC